ncbi:MAG: hypothetical protein PHW52_03930 [Candidatus Pacebacteria bacterium]|nr:hypothetical protein [Candidatus Paceibacterota bacterium]
MNKIKLISLISFIGTFFTQAALAVCPVCVIGASAGLGLARWLKIDDTITGVWIGGLTVGIIMWTIEWFNKKKINFWGKDVIIIASYYIMVIWPLHSIEVIGSEYHTIWGMDKLIFSIFVGSATFLVFEKWYRSMRAKRGKSLFKYQKVVWALIPLLILSIIFYFITK